MFLKFMWRSKIYTKHPRTHKKIIKSHPSPSPPLLSLIPSLAFSVASPIHSSPGAHPSWSHLLLPWPAALLSWQPPRAPPLSGGRLQAGDGEVSGAKRGGWQGLGSNVGDGGSLAAQERRLPPLLPQLAFLLCHDFLSPLLSSRHGGSQEAGTVATKEAKPGWSHWALRHLPRAPASSATSARSGRRDDDSTESGTTTSSMAHDGDDAGSSFSSLPFMVNQASLIFPPRRRAYPLLHSVGVTGAVRASPSFSVFCLLGFSAKLWPPQCGFVPLPMRLHAINQLGEWVINLGSALFTRGHARRTWQRVFVVDGSGPMTLVCIVNGLRLCS